MCNKFFLGTQTAYNSAVFLYSNFLFLMTQANVPTHCTTYLNNGYPNDKVVSRD